MKDGWICVEPANVKLPGIETMTAEQALAKAAAAGAVALKVQSLAELKARHRSKPSATIAFRTVASNFPVLNVRPTWFYFDGSVLPEISEPTPPGADAREFSEHWAMAPRRSTDWWQKELSVGPSGAQGRIRGRFAVIGL